MNGMRTLISSVVGGGLAAGAALALGAAWPKQTVVTPQTLPADSAARIAQGRAYFAMSCAHCHADDATGDEGPNLHKLTISDAHISLVVKNGIKGEMPNFSNKYDDSQVAAITAFLRTLD